MIIIPLEECHLKLLFIYFTILSSAICLILLPSLPLMEWIYFSLLFFCLVYSIGFLSFYIRNFWISFPLSFLAVIVFTYLINELTSAEIPYRIIVVMGIIYTGVGHFITRRRDKGEL